MSSQKNPLGLFMCGQVQWNNAQNATGKTKIALLIKTADIFVWIKLQILLRHLLNTIMLFKQIMLMSHCTQCYLMNVT